MKVLMILEYELEPDGGIKAALDNLAFVSEDGVRADMVHLLVEEPAYKVLSVIARASAEQEGQEGS